MKYDDKEDEDIDFGSGGMDQYATYDELHVNEASTSIRDKATNLIDGLARIYTAVGSMVDEQYIDSLKSIETDSLVSMLKQVKYSEHMLDTMMKRLDNGGYVDKEIYDQIKAMQLHVIQMNLEVSKYHRLLGDAFKFVESGISSTQQLQRQEYNQIDNNSSIKGIDAEFVAVPLNGPQFGTKAFLETIGAMDSLDNIDKILEEEPENELDFDPNEISDDDDFDEDGNIEESNIDEN